MKDKYGRILGEVFLSDGRSVNRELVKAGSPGGSSSTLMSRAWAI